MFVINIYTLSRVSNFHFLFYIFKWYWIVTNILNDDELQLKLFPEHSIGAKPKKEVTIQHPQSPKNRVFWSFVMKDSALIKKKRHFFMQNCSL